VTDTILRDLSPATFPAVLDANRVASARFFAAMPGGWFRDEAGITWFETGVPLDFLNGVVRTQLDREGLPYAIERVVAHFVARRLPFQWRVGPTSHPKEQGALLQRLGIGHVEDEPGMAVDLHTLQKGLPVC
jgi:hypothetical protein